MHRRITALAAAVLMLATIAAPATATTHRPIRGHMDMELNLGFFSGEGAAPEVTWYGTVDIKRASYPVVYYGGLLEDNDGWVYWEDRYEILDTLSTTVEGGVITKFEPGNVIFEVTERGWGTPWGTFFALGKVVAADVDADPHGLLDRVSVDDAVVYWGHNTGDAGLAFVARMRIFATG